jgi:hypothetical protein
MSANALLESGLPNYGAADLDKVGKKKQPHIGNSWVVTAGLVIANTGGAAALDMPSAFTGFGGWLPGTICLLLLVLMNMHLSVITWRLYMCFPEQSTYAGVIRQSFGKASPTQQGFMVYAAAISQYGYCFTCVGWNILSLGMGTGYLFPDWHVCLPMLMLIWFFIMLPCQMTMRQVGSWKSLIFANLIFATLLVAIPLMYFVGAGVKNTRVSDSSFKMLTATNAGGIFSSASTIAFMLTTQYLVVEFAQEMQDPKEFPQSYARIAVPFQFAVYFLAGCGGYYYLGAAGSGMMFDYLPFGSALSWSAVCFLGNLVLATLINGVVFCRAFHAWWDPEFAENNSMRDWTWWSVVVVIVLFAAWLLGNLVPFFSDLVDLLGTTIGPISCYVIPILSYVRCYRDFQESDMKLSRISSSEWVVIAVEFIIALSLISYGTYVQLSKIISGWASYGYPFQCHCELLWATCACSAARPGMEMCHANGTIAHIASFPH